MFIGYLLFSTYTLTDSHFNKKSDGSDFNKKSDSPREFQDNAGERK